MQHPAMATTPYPRRLAVRASAALAAAGLPALLRSTVHAAVAGPVTSAHVLLMQVAFLALAAEGARRAASALGAERARWRAWAVDAVSVAGAVVLIAAGRVASGHGRGTPLTLEAITLVVIAPIVEEIVYRGLLPGILAPRVRGAGRGARWSGGGLMASAAFALGHVVGSGEHGASAVRTFALSFGCGLAFQLLRDSSGGLTAPMAAHAGVNAMSLAATG